MMKLWARAYEWYDEWIEWQDWKWQKLFSIKMSEWRKKLHRDVARFRHLMAKMCFISDLVHVIDFTFSFFRGLSLSLDPKRIFWNWKSQWFFIQIERFFDISNHTIKRISHGTIVYSHTVTTCHSTHPSHSIISSNLYHFHRLETAETSTSNWNCTQTWNAFSPTLSSNWPKSTLNRAHVHAHTHKRTHILILITFPRSDEFHLWKYEWTRTHCCRRRRRCCCHTRCHRGGGRNEPNIGKILFALI